jgi:hypothetical protein
LKPTSERPPTSSAGQSTPPITSTTSSGCCSPNVSITDPEFWDDFKVDGKIEEDLKTAAIRKTTELRKVVYKRMTQNHHQYAKFSDRLRELLEKLDGTQLS